MSFCKVSRFKISPALELTTPNIYSDVICEFPETPTNVIIKSGILSSAAYSALALNISKANIIKIYFLSLIYLKILPKFILILLLYLDCRAAAAQFPCPSLEQREHLVIRQSLCSAFHCLICLNIFNNFLRLCRLHCLSLQLQIFI